IEVVPIHGSFAELPRILESRGIQADMVLADLGFSSNQVEDPDRGFSFRVDGPLDMRLDPNSQLTVAAMINELSEGELADVIFQYGEVRASRRIARAIVARRRERAFERTGDLADVVRRAAGPPPKGRRRIDRATRTFQALRIAVNGELEALDAFLHAVSQGARAAVEGRPGWLGLGSRVGVISFHSLEDRPVKRALAAIEAAGHGRRLTRKPIVAGECEQRANARSRSAKLRGLEVVSKMG
ncbi:MAG TPA: 16S rRNA (cytosine(1402)-N(4))-methyltransferase, partial [Phycisphaerales bacterium]|nr:16S rRNA (cytosine(1402)-N(4))-methyltransferase [Phycisphaerales bacterium]